jgi:hypothetical protein
MPDLFAPAAAMDLSNPSSLYQREAYEVLIRYSHPWAAPANKPNFFVN